jgi:hypothetical protein
MDWQAVPKKTSDVTTRRIDDYLFVVDPHTSELHSMNDVAGCIWELIDGVRTLEQIATEVVAQYDADEATIRADVEEFVGMLRARRLLSV